MTSDEETSKRAQRLVQELRDDAKRYLSLARANYYLALCLSVTVVVASAAAGVGGITKWVADPAILGAIALTAALASGLLLTLKPQARADWHYRKVDRLNTLRRKIDFELGLPLPPGGIAAISAARSRLDEEMSFEWERTIAGADTERPPP